MNDSTSRTLTLLTTGHAAAVTKALETFQTRWNANVAVGRESSSVADPQTWVTIQRDSATLRYSDSDHVDEMLAELHTVTKLEPDQWTLVDENEQQRLREEQEAEAERVRQEQARRRHEAEQAALIAEQARKAVQDERRNAKLREVQSTLHQLGYTWQEVGVAMFIIGSFGWNPRADNYKVCWPSYQTMCDHFGIDYAKRGNFTRPISVLLAGHIFARPRKGYGFKDGEKMSALYKAVRLSEWRTRAEALKALEQEGEECFLQ